MADADAGFDGGYEKIITALHKASMPALRQIAHAGGQALKNISRKAFAEEADPAGGAKRAPLKYPRGEPAKNPGSAPPVPADRGTLRRPVSFNAFSDGPVITGSNLVYAGIRQRGGKTKARGIKPRSGKALKFPGIYRRLVKHPGSDIPARPFLGVPKDFERQFFDGPAIRKLLGMAAE